MINGNDFAADGSVNRNRETVGSFGDDLANLNLVSDFDFNFAGRALLY